MSFKLAVTTLALVSVALSGCSSTATLSGTAAASSLVATVSPVITVLGVTKSVIDVINAKGREYTVKIRAIDVDQRTALKMSFEEACQVAVGSVISSERESNDRALVRDNINNYSSCYVKSHKIISSKNIGDGRTEIVVDVTVARSNVANRVLGKSESGTDLQGGQHADRIDTLNESNRNRQRLIDSVMHDYPQRAWKVEIERSRTITNSSGGRFVEVPFIVSIDPDYMNSLKGLLDAVAVRPAGKVLGSYPLGPIGGGNAGQIQLFGNTGVLGVGWNELYSFNDRNAYNSIHTKLSQNLLIAVDFYINGSWRTQCWSPSVGYQPILSSGPDLTIVKNTRTSRIRDRVLINASDPASLELIRNITEIKVRITDVCR